MNVQLLKNYSNYIELPLFFDQKSTDFPGEFTGKFYKTFEGESIPILNNLFQDRSRRNAS